MTLWDKPIKDMACAGSVLSKKGLVSRRDIRGHVLPFVRLSLVYYSIHSPFTRLSAIR